MASAKKADREARIEVKMPDLPDGASCAEAATAYRESWSLDGHDQRADLTEGQYAMILGRDRYFQHCELPARYEVAICAAVQNGQVLGASVSTSPRSPRHEACIDRSLRALDFPVHPRMDVTRTVFQN
ncbi:MAG: hypothetical protein KC731_06715 [Myxococcales bacterium]|nr:hypothetical protein [Myxococcales bacterium]